MIKIEMLRCFRAVVEHGRLADAAETLGRTTSAVSMTLSQFEEQVGKPLFETTRKSKLTPLGAQIYQETRRELDHYDRTISNIMGLASAQFGKVRLAVTPSVGSTIMPDILQAYLAAYPDVQIEMRDMPSSEVQIALARDEADIGIATLGPAPGLELRRLFTDPFGVVCSRQAPLAKKRTTVMWSDLAEETFISNGLCSLITDPAFRPILQNASLHVPNTSSLLALVQAGIGVTLLPKLAISLMGSDLKFLPLAEDQIHREVSMATAEAHLLSPAVSAFIGTILDTKFKLG